MSLLYFLDVELRNIANFILVRDWLATSKKKKKKKLPKFADVISV